jgi:hypothetical protein
MSPKTERAGRSLISHSNLASRDYQHVPLSASFSLECIVEGKLNESFECKAQWDRDLHVKFHRHHRQTQQFTFARSFIFQELALD